MQVGRIIDDVREMLRRMQLGLYQDIEDEVDDSVVVDGDDAGPLGMELLPLEHYDYVVMMFKSPLDWVRALDILGIEDRHDPRMRKTRKVGLCRVIDGTSVIDRLIGDQA